MLAVVLGSALLIGCGGASRTSAEDTARQWGDAVNAHDWSKACALMSSPKAGCERRTRQRFAGTRLTFDGPAVNGGGTRAGDAYFSFSGDSSGVATVFVTAIKQSDGYRLRLEAVVGQ